VFDQDGNIEAAVVVNVDITDRKQHERELECVSALSYALRAASNSAEMLPVILDQLLLMLDVEAALIAKPDPAGGSLFIELGCGLWEETTERTLPADSRLCQEAFRTGKIQTCSQNDIQLDPACAVLCRGLSDQCQSVAAAPMMVGKDRIGLLGVASVRQLNEHDLSLLAAIADIAANAIHRATLHEQTEKRLRQLSALRAIDEAISSSFDLNFILTTLVGQAALQLKADAVAVLLFNPATLRLEYAAGFGFLYPDIRSTSLRLGEGQAGRAALERRTLSIPDLTGASTGLGRTDLVTKERFVSHHVTSLTAKGQVVGVLEVFNRSRLEPDPEWIGYFEAFANQAAIAIDNAQLFEELQRSNLDLSLAYDATIEGWSRAMDLRDHETEGHTRRVTDLTIQLARSLNVAEDQITHIRRGALLHDIGKLGIPDMILLKPGRLTPEEWNLMRKHPQYAHDMLNSIEYLRPAIDIPYCHHEKWDGTGYPRGLKGEQIPFSARLFAVADVFDALTSDRPYRAAWSVEQALEYIRQEAGKHFDPRVVEAFLRIFKE